MNIRFARALAACALGAAVAAPAFAANDLTGTTVGVSWLYPSDDQTFAEQDVVVGPGAEIQCPGGDIGGGLCAGFFNAADIDVGAQTLSLTIDSGVIQWTPGASFDGYEFSNLSAGGPWYGYTLSTTFNGLDSSRITFTTDAVFVNMVDLVAEEGQSFTITLLGSPAIPEPASPVLMLAGLGALAAIARRRHAQR